MVLHLLCSCCMCWKQWRLQVRLYQISSPHWAAVCRIILCHWSCGWLLYERSGESHAITTSVSPKNSDTFTLMLHLLWHNLHPCIMFFLMLSEESTCSGISKSARECGSQNCSISAAHALSKPEDFHNCEDSIKQWEVQSRYWKVLIISNSNVLH